MTDLPCTAPSVACAHMLLTLSRTMMVNQKRKESRGSMSRGRANWNWKAVRHMYGRRAGERKNETAYSW